MFSILISMLDEIKSNFRDTHHGRNQLQICYRNGISIGSVIPIESREKNCNDTRAENKLNVKAIECQNGKNESVIEYVAGSRVKWIMKIHS